MALTLALIILLFAIINIVNKRKKQEGLHNEKLEQLRSYTQEKIKQGYTKEQITKAAKQAGWNEQDIKRAME